MADPAYTVTVTDPSRRTSILAEHTGLSVRDVRELVQIYFALGYDAEHVLIRVAAAARVA